jgi:WhiB family redox-sensing transcriptional regulator
MSADVDEWAALAEWADDLLEQPTPDTRQAHHKTRGTFAPQPWADEALCAQTDPELFFPEKGGSVREAIATCRACPVAAECLDYALANNERFGVWGGLSEPARERLTATTSTNTTS